jgi:hypothetical protein
VKTTIEIPDPIFRQAKAAAAERGQSLKDYFAEALGDRLRRQGGLETGAKPWEPAFGALRDLHRENRRIERLIAAEFGTIDEEQWR